MKGVRKKKKYNVYGEELTTIKVSSYVRRMLERFQEIGGYRCMDDVIAELIIETIDDIPILPRKGVKIRKQKLTVRTLQSR